MAEGKDFWDILDMLLKPVSGLFTALAVGLVGYYGSSVIDRSQARNADTHLYAQLMSQREGAETSLRKDMFNSIIGSFLKTKPTGYDYEQQVLNLELLAYNFHEALDLAPLFKDVYMKIRDSKHPHAEEYMTRLEKVASEVKSKQIAILEESGGKLDSSINIEELDKNLGGLPVFDGTVSPRSPLLQRMRFKVEAISVNPRKKEMRVKLEVRSADATSAGAKPEDPTYSLFTVSPFDFPMIDNTRLPNGDRCAIVVKRFGEFSVEVALVYFPGSRASLKDKPFYDEAIRDLKRRER
jgi:hypothetical protein